MGYSRSQKAFTIIVFAILFLFFFQLLTDSVAGIYAYGVLGTGLPIEMAALVLFLSPFLLLLFGRGLPPAVLIILGELVLLARSIEIMLPTRTQLLVAALGVGLFLFLFPALLWDRGQKRDKTTGPLMAAGLLLAVAFSILLRSFGATMDLSNVGMFKAGAWLLAIIAAVLLPRVFHATPDPAEAGDPARPTAGWGKSIVLASGMVAVFLLLYFAFTSPTVISRWTGSNYLMILAVVVLALVSFAWLLAAGQKTLGKISRNTALILTAIFGLALTLTLAVNQVAMPKEAAGFPLIDPELSAVWIIALLALLLLFPVLFLDFGLLVEETTLGRPSMRQLGLGFGLASLIMLLLIMANIFTSTWSYVEVALEPLVRNRFWHIHLIVALILTLSLLAVSNKSVKKGAEAAGQSIGRSFAILVTAFGIVALLTAVILSPSPATPDTAGPLKVAGYNLQQGYNAAGQRGHQEQCQVLEEIDADIIALSESDTSRIAGGNFDIVRFLAQCLDMHSYVGPKTGTGTFGYALLSRYPIKNAQTIHLFSGPGLPSPTGPEEFSDGDQVAVIKAQVSAGDETFTIFVNHFDSDPPFEQPQGFAGLAAGLDNVIAIGDYNCRPDSECFAIMAEVLDHCDPTKAEGHIDHIFVSAGLACPNYTYIDSTASDHPAVATEITW
jgi:endonuclease/exonuclease/phosphatase family metal-dependent hydrolase